MKAERTPYDLITIEVSIRPLIRLLPLSLHLLLGDFDWKHSHVRLKCTFFFVKAVIFFLKSVFFAFRCRLNVYVLRQLYCEDYPNKNKKGSCPDIAVVAEGKVRLFSKLKTVLNLMHANKCNLLLGLFFHNFNLSKIIKNLNLLTCCPNTILTLLHNLIAIDILKLTV